MKYLKDWKIFENNLENYDLDEIKSNLSDYLLDLKDDGLIVNVLYDNDQVYRFKNKDTRQYFRISVYDYKSEHVLSEIEISKYKYNIENVIEYMDDLGYKLDYILTDMSSSVKGDPKDHLIKCINSNRKIDLLDMFFVEKKSKLNESHSEEQFIETIKDILLEISDDEAYDIKYLKFQKYKENKVEDYLEIQISRDKEDPHNIRRTKRTIPGAPVPPGGQYPDNLFLWFEIKDPIIRLCEYVYEELELSPGINSKIFNDLRNMGIEYKSNSPFRMFNGGVEFGIGWMSEEDFTLGDFLSFTSLKIQIRL